MPPRPIFVETDFLDCVKASIFILTLRNPSYSFGGVMSDSAVVIDTKLVSLILEWWDLMVKVFLGFSLSRTNALLHKFSLANRSH